MGWLTRADSACVAGCEHRVRFSSAVRCHNSRRRLADLAVRLFTRKQGIPATDGAERARIEPPLGLIRTFATDDDAAHRGTLDIKTRGTRLFVDAARVFALAFGIHDTNTVSRLRAAGRALRVEARHVEATVEAFHFLQLLRLRLQDATAEHGQSEPARSRHAERSRPEDAEGGVPPGAQAAGPARAHVRSLTTAPAHANACARARCAVSHAEGRRPSARPAIGMATSAAHRPRASAPAGALCHRGCRDDRPRFAPRHADCDRRDERIRWRNRLRRHLSGCVAADDGERGCEHPDPRHRWGNPTRRARSRPRDA